MVKCSGCAQHSPAQGGSSGARAVLMRFAGLSGVSAVEVEPHEPSLGLSASLPKLAPRSAARPLFIENKWRRGWDSDRNGFFLFTNIRVFNTLQTPLAPLASNVLHPIAPGHLPNSLNASSSTSPQSAKQDHDQICRYRLARLTEHPKLDWIFGRSWWMIELEPPGDLIPAVASKRMLLRIRKVVSRQHGNKPRNDNESCRTWDRC